jgi:hydroxypyruvate reductase
MIAAGKAAARMAAASIEVFGEAGREVAGAVVVDISPADVGHPAVEALCGDHPIPGAASLAAAERIGMLAARIPPGEPVLVLLSGGASSLMAAPVAGLVQDDLARLFELLLSSGLDIHTMNPIRKRFARHGAGRLRAALGGARVRAAALSDVIRDDPAIIASGPCEPDPVTAAEVIARLRDAELWHRTPERARAYVEAVARGELPETPKPGDPLFTGVRPTTVTGNLAAIRSACSTARRLGVPLVKLVQEPMRGDAAACGGSVARALLALRAGAGTLTCLVQGGETTLRLGDAPGRGGRCQHLALAAARSLDAADAGEAITLLVAGTDGRDGPTDAAGAMVDGTTWQRIRAAGRDPERDLAARDSYPSLAAAGALLRTGPTGTNVGDIIVGLVSQ